MEEMENGELNLIPYLDIVTNLTLFLLATVSAGLILVQIDTTLLATRADVEALLRGSASARLTQGWRADVLGQDIQNLVEGRAALSFDGKGNLILEDRN